jgi:rod shape-determining protein MreC
VLIEETRDQGIIGPDSGDPLDDSIIDVTYLSRNAVISPGHRVITSGLGGIFPKGIPIGQVLDSRSANFGLYREARVKLSANLSQLEEVLVLVP